MKKAKGKAKATFKPRFVMAEGSPFSQEDAEVIGRELLLIAEANKVDDIRSLDKALVLATVEADKDHPLRAYFTWDVKKAARSHWLQQAASLIRSVRIITPKLSPLGRPMPLFLNDPDHAKRSPGVARRSRVVSQDLLLTEDPAFLSSLAQQIRQSVFVLERLEHVTRVRRAPPDVARYRDAWRTAVDEYLGAIASSAAEE